VLEPAVVDARDAIARRPDEIDEIIALERLRQPVGEGSLGAIAALGQRLERGPQIFIANEEIEVLGIAGDPGVVQERVRTADEQPVIYSRDRIPARLLRPDLDLLSLDPSLFALLRSSGHAADHATATLHAVASTSFTAKVLGVRRGKPLLYIEEIDYDTGYTRPGSRIYYKCSRCSRKTIGEITG